MRSDIPDVWQFGEFRLDVRRKVLWHGERSVPMPLKELEVLSMLVRSRGELVTKDELLTEIWEDSFVEESNLSRHIYLLRKTLKDLGAGGLIENVPRRGYRFSGEAHPVEADEIILEKHTRTRTMIEFQEAAVPAGRTLSYRRLAAYAAIVVILAASAFLGPRYPGSQTQDSGIRSIAVLPFRMLSTDPNMSHVGSGLADILTTRLSSIRELKVRPANAIAGLENPDVVVVGQKLEVDGVLEGTIYHFGDRIRVTARLVRTGDGSIVWSGEFDKTLRDELQLQYDLASQIVPVLAVNLTPGERDAVAKKYTESPDAYDLYLKGRFEWNKRSTPGMVKAQRMFRNAIDADPGFALAYIGLADVLLTNQPAAHEAAVILDKALKLDPNLGEAHASRGFYLMFYGWNWKEAEESFRRSIDLNPNYATAHHWYATLLAIKGETDAAKLEMQKALELNPVSHNFLADLGKLHYFSGEYAEAEKYCLKALDIYPDFMFAHEHLHYIYLKTERYEEAVVEIAKADAINGAVTHEVQKVDETMARFRSAFQKSGINGYLELRFPGTATSPESFYLYAMKHAFIGDNKKALDYLEKSTDAQMFLSAFVKAEPIFEQLRSEPRYQKILRKMGLA